MNSPSLIKLSLLVGSLAALGTGRPIARDEEAPHGDVRLRHDLGNVTNTMRGGIGASWHAIEKPLPYSEQPDPVFQIKSHGGSGWGAYPPAGDQAAWDQIDRHARWLGLDFNRVEIEQRIYEPAPGRFTWDSPEMLILYKILDWCERNRADVFLQPYNEDFDWLAKGMMVQADRNTATWTAGAHREGKAFFLSEFGTMANGWGGDHPGPGLFPSVLKDAELVIRRLNAGVDGFNRWSFLNRGDLDGQWQFVETWDRKQKRLLGQFTPHPNTYFLLGLLTRFTAKHSDVLMSELDGGQIDS